VFIFIYNDTEFYTTDKITIPLTILEYQDNLNSFLFKLFKKACKLHALSYVQIFNENKFTITQIQFSNAKINEKSKISKLSSSIERKNLSNFVGRKTDIIDLTRKILNLSDRILTIKGSGGIGKTTIAKKIALEFFDRSYFIDGIHFIDCEAINDLQTFKRNIAKTFNLEEAINFEEHVRNYELRKDSLIILDNFETLLDLSERSEIKQLITFISNFVTIIITSREWVGFEFEEKHELRNFTREEAFDLFQNLYSHELNNEEERRILQKDILEKLLNNNPLAIKIVTKNLPKFTEMSALRDELRTNFFKATNTDYEDIFHSPSDENIERSESLYQSIYYSYAKLSPKEQLTFEILSLFPNGIQMESFKEFFQNKTYMITNKEIKRLEDKSLIEINNGHLTLQSIIGRFADFHLNQRSADEKIDYFKSAYNYNLYLLTLLIEKKQAGRTNQALKIYDKFEDNFIKSLNYIKETGIENTTLIAYITSLIPFSSLIGSMSKITNQFHKCTKIFMNVPNGELLKEILLLTSDYYEKDLDKPFEYLKEKNMLEQLDTLDLDTIEITNSQIVVKVLSIYATEGYHFEAIEFMHRRKHYEIIDFGISLMCLGSFNHVIKLQEEKNVPKDFFYFESKYNLGILTIEEIDEYIQNDIFNKRHMEIMQSNYLKTKMGFAEKEIIEKLVVTNTYTMGLKNLMLAILEENVDVKINLFEQAISNLKHIHYYYTEAIYFYCAFLKTINSNTFDLWYNLGRNSAEKSYYKYLIHKYYSMENNSCILYDENNYSLPDEFNVQLFIDEYLNSRRSELSYNNL
ncbi:NB-ARC domain-containing protein, partial [Bacillus toyonensis]|uniref:NB-ARC domain-containing protein n=1 Tax=Bacillus toyonensis TaxID=155322 RepID=UPI002E1D4A51